MAQTWVTICKEKPENHKNLVKNDGKFQKIEEKHLILFPNPQLSFCEVFHSKVHIFLTSLPSLSKLKNCVFTLCIFQNSRGFSDFPALPRYLGQFCWLYLIEWEILHRICIFVYFLGAFGAWCLQTVLKTNLP